MNNEAQEKAENLIEAEFQGYVQELAAVGLSIFIEHIQPLLRERKYTFFNEGGKYRLLRADGSVCTPNNARGDQGLWDVLQLMQLNVQGTNNRLGDFMPDYSPDMESASV